MPPSPHRPAKRPSHDVWRLILGLWAVGAAAMIASGLAAAFEGVPVTIARAISMALVGVALSLVVWRVSAVGGHPLVKIGLLVATVVGVSIGHTVLDMYADSFLRTVAGEGRLRRQIISDSVLRGLVMALIAQSHVVIFAALHSVVGIAATTLRWAAETREREAQLAAARTEAVGAQLALLRHQLNPHFIFNTLNAIGSLVATNRNADAEEMIDRLSGFLRAALVADAQPFTSLDDELATLQAYLEIEHTRFGDRLGIAWDITPGMRDISVPNFLLQPLVENAIKHAVAPALRPVQVRISAQPQGDDLVIAVADTGAGPEAAGSPRPGVGVGLKNVRDRLRLIYGDRASLETGPESDGFTARIRLPLDAAAVAA